MEIPEQLEEITVFQQGLQSRGFCIEIIFFLRNIADWKDKNWEVSFVFQNNVKESMSSTDDGQKNPTNVSKICEQQCIRLQY